MSIHDKRGYQRVKRGGARRNEINGSEEKYEMQNTKYSRDDRKLYDGVRLGRNTHTHIHTHTRWDLKFRVRIT